MARDVALPPAASQRQVPQTSPVLPSVDNRVSATISEHEVHQADVAARAAGVVAGSTGRLLLEHVQPMWKRTGLVVDEEAAVVTLIAEGIGPEGLRAGIVHPVWPLESRLVP